MERDTVVAIGFFWGELERLHDSCLSLLAQKVVPLPALPEVQGPVAPWQMPLTADMQVRHSVGVEYQKFSDSLGPAEQEAWEAWESYRYDQWRRTQWRRGEAGQCMRCGLRLGAAFLVDELVCVPCFDLDDSVVEARNLLGSVGVQNPSVEGPGAHFYCREEAARTEWVDRMYGFDPSDGGRACCSCSRAIGSCLGKIYRSDRDARLKAERFLAGLCEMCGVKAAIGVCDPCNEILAREYRAEVDSGRDDFFSELYLENPSRYMDIFC